MRAAYVISYEFFRTSRFPFSLLAISSECLSSRAQDRALCFHCICLRTGAGRAGLDVSSRFRRGRRARTHGRTEGRTPTKTDKRTDGRTDARTHGRTGRRTDGRTDRRTDARTDGRADGRTGGRRTSYLMISFEHLSSRSQFLQFLPNSLNPVLKIGRSVSTVFAPVLAQAAPD